MNSSRLKRNRLIIENLPSRRGITIRRQKKEENMEFKFSKKYYCEKFSQSYGGISLYKVDEKLVVVPCGTHIPPLVVGIESNNLEPHDDIVWLKSSRSGRTRSGLFVFKQECDVEYNPALITSDYGIIKIENRDENMYLFWNEKQSEECGLAELYPESNSSPWYGYWELDAGCVKLIVPEQYYALFGILFDKNLNRLYKVVETSKYFVCAGVAFKKEEVIHE